MTRYKHPRPPVEGFERARDDRYPFLVAPPEVTPAALAAWMDTLGLTPGDLEQLTGQHAETWRRWRQGKTASFPRTRITTIPRWVALIMYNLADQLGTRLPRMGLTHHPYFDRILEADPVPYYPEGED